MSTSDTSVATQPSTVLWSFRLYIGGAILGLVGAIVLIALLPGQLSTAQGQLNYALQGQDTKGVDVSGIATGAAIGGVIFSVVLTVVFSVLTIVFARKFSQGKNWARIVLAVMAGLQIFGVAGAVGVGALHFVVVLVALILSFLSASNAWFRAMKPVASTTA